MKFLVYVALATLCFSLILSDRNVSHIRHRRIIDGTIAKFGEYPFIAKILWYWRRPKARAITCSATAISSDFVITAARCYQLVVEHKKKRDDRKLIVNLTKTYATTQVDLNGHAKAGGFTQKRTGVKLFVHTAYVHVSTMFDINIALVQLNKPWKIEYPVQIPKMAIPITEDGFVRCVGVGIGRTSTTDEKKRVNWFKVSVGGVRYCKYLQNQFNKRIVHFDTFYMCTKALSPNQDLCMGDIGGALICDGLFAGVMSQRIQKSPCQVGGGQFTLYTSVGAPQVLEWIKNYVPDLAAPSEIPIPDPWDITTRRP